jgi:DNA adenine methylase
MNGLENSTFVEVFAGGAGSAVSLLLKGHVKALFLNDLDVAVYSFWKSVKERPVDLVDLIRTTRVSMAEWRRQKAIYSAKDVKDALALGFATFYLNRCNHSGILEARPIGGMKQETAYRINARYNKSTSIAKIQAIAKYASAIEVFNMDGIDFLKLLRRRHRNRKCLIYLDPPYYQKGPELYLNHFGHRDHEELRDCVLNCPFPWVLSYDYNDNIIDLYRRRKCSLYLNHIRHTITGNSKAEELIISRATLPGYLGRIQQCFDQEGA